MEGKCGWDKALVEKPFLLNASKWKKKWLYHIFRVCFIASKYFSITYVERYLVSESQISMFSVRSGLG